MRLKLFRRLSLKTRVTLFTLVIFVLSIWSLSFYVSQMLRQDMQHLLSDQQFSTVSVVADQVNQELASRLQILSKVAAVISPAILGTPPALQLWLQESLILQGPFNGGIFVTGLDGVVVASVPISIEGVPRVGVSYIDRDFIIAALSQGKSTIGKPVMGKLFRSPIFSMVVPIFDTQGKVLGALAGVVNLAKPNFLDKIISNPYGKTGGYLLVGPQYRLVITATDKRRIMDPNPPVGVIPAIDRFTAGYEGSAVFVDPLSNKVLASAKGVPVAGWYLAASLPTAEAFAPIRDMQLRMRWPTMMLTLLAGGLTWWMLRRELAPMLSTVETLAKLSGSNRSPHALPITRQDEVGELIGGFNRLLDSLAKRQQALTESEERWQFALEGAGAGVWDWNIQTGEALFSRRWKEMLGFTESEIKNNSAEWTSRLHPDDIPDVMAIIQAHIDGKTPVASAEFRMLCKDGRWQWTLGRGMVVSHDADGKPMRLIGTNTDITERKQMQEHVRQLAFYDPLTELPNRRLLIDRLSHALADSKRSSCYGALMFLDLDNFKSLNDTQGHTVGDILLLQAAKRMKACVREVDTVARLGGDEFVVMVGDLNTDKVASTAQTASIAEKIRSALAEPYLLTVKHPDAAAASIEHLCSASIGVVVFIEREGSQEDFLKWADDAMYQAKEAGGNLIRFYAANARANA